MSGMPCWRSTINSSQSLWQKVLSNRQTDTQTRPKLCHAASRIINKMSEGANGWGMSGSRFYSVVAVACHTLPCLLDHQHLPQTYITFIVENHSVVLRCASTCPGNQLISSASSASSDPVSFQSASFCQCRFITFSLLTFRHFHYPTFFLVFRVMRVLWLRMLIGYLTSSSSSSSTDVFRMA